MNREQQTGKITARQLIVLLIVSRCVVVLNRPASFCTDMSAREVLLALLISVGIVALLDSSPVKRILHNVRGNAVTKWLLIVLFLISSIRTMLALVIFFQAETETLFPVLPIIFLAMSVVLFALVCGMEGIARFAPIIAVLFVAVVGFTILTNGMRMEITNLLFPEASATVRIANAVLADTLLCPEIAAYFVLRRYLRKEDKPRASLRTFYSIQAGMIALFALAQELVFGSFAKLQSYPIYAMAVVGEFSIFQRLDVLHIAIWILVCIVKLCTLSLAGTSLLQDLYPKKKPNVCAAIVCVIVAVGTLLLLGVFTTRPAVLEGAAISCFVLSALSALFSINSKRQLKPKETTT